MVGTGTASVTVVATASGTHSSTIEKQPASARATASSRSARAASNSLACTLKPPSMWTDCGVSPRCPMTGISASSMAATMSSRLRPPSSLTADAPARSSLAALRTVSSRDTW